MTPPISSGASEEVMRDYRFSQTHRNDQVVSAIESIMKEATEREDYELSVDDVIPGVKLARRVRRISNCGSRRDFTLRAYRSSGSKTEFQKLSDGTATCTHYSYAWSNSWQLRELIVVDMAIFKKSYLQFPSGVKKNADGKTGFLWWPIENILGCIVAHKEYSFEMPPSKLKCTDCWENRSKWVGTNGRVLCGKCGRFIGYERQ